MTQNSGLHDTENLQSDWLDRRWAKVWAFALIMPRYYRLWLVFIGIGIFFVIFKYLTVNPTYTAVAVVGPPGPSPRAALMGSMGSGLGSVGRILSGGGSNSQPYQDFMQMLPSSRLAQVLIDRDHLLQVVYARNWDPNTKQWKKPGTLRSIVNGVSKTFHFPIGPSEPGVDTLTKFLTTRLSIKSADKGINGGLLTRSDPYLAVSLTYRSPEEAERLLSLILSEADNIIRENQRRDVSSRISFIKRQLARQDITADERTALISVLSEQEQLFTMTEADQRYASNLIIPPYASERPTSPPGIGKMILYVLVFTGLIWGVVVFVGLRSDRFYPYLDRFKSRR